LPKKQGLDIPSPLRSAEEWAVNEILRSSEYLNGCLNEALKPYDISFTQYSALRILSGEEEGLPSSAIGERMITRDTDVTRLVDRLAARGLVERYRDENDRRIARVRLTSSGTELLNRLEGPTLQLAASRFAAVKPKRIRRLIEVLRDLRQADPL
jgi:DNA-binding MarR family transcriptional regulator